MSAPQANRLRSDYVENPPVSGNGTSVEAEYWTTARIRRSRKYQFDVYRLARSVAAESGTRNVVDLGCGVATKLNLFFPDPFTVVGIDTEEAVDKCRRLWRRGTYIVDDLENPRVTLTDVVESVDLIICSDVLEHLAAPANLMRLIRQSASPATGIVLSTPSRDHLVGPEAITPSIPEHCREWSFAEFRLFVEGSGLRVERHLLQRPLRLGLDWVTFQFLVNRLQKRLPLRTTQTMVCSAV
jgi:SAM-dependent methyltransferase